ncbi:N-acetylglucosamine/diacetylchitobiose ABC transporter substrate-binding protein [uncultured Amnibacterium sp.]|uniref:N-acetylglucosamine/diacetylchitobiose ABC transporter substrate-binding protein n=1 Tax=uncultured Amnibacterium sp. TaxID=1631851 RepID=UPI0035CB50DB
MTEQHIPMPRRAFLRGALVAGIALPLAGTLASCAAGGSTGGASSGTGTKSATNPFGVKEKSAVAASIFNGGYGTDYVDFAAAVMAKQKLGVTAKVDQITNIAQSLQPKFVAGNPPDLVDNSGANAIGISTIRSQLSELSDLLDSNNYEGKKISDTLYGGVTAPGTLDGKFLILNYVLTVYALWYSASLFKANGWTVPKTWDEAYELGVKAKAKGKYLFIWGKEAATYYQTLAIASAIKEGGDDVRLALENLEAKCWSKPAVQSVFTAMKKIIDAGMFKPGGAGTQFTAAQAQWSNDEDGLLYPSGSWIENEMKKQTKADFQMTGAPEPTVTAGSKLPYEAMHSTAGEPFIVPAKGANAAGGKELLRAMLSAEAATNFAKTRLTPTIVKGTVPADGFGSTALVSQSTLLEGAGDNVFSWNFVDLYGMNQDQLVVWNTFLSGKSSVAQLTSGLQGITDKVANDSSVTKVKVS